MTLRLAPVLSMILLACAASSEDDAAPELAEDIGDVDQADVALTAAEPAATTPLVLWIAPKGSDAADGSEAHPLATISGAHEHLHALYPVGRPLDRDVEIRIAPGTYAGDEVRWTLPSSDHSIAFMPAGFHAGMRFADVKALGGRPVFDGKKACDGKGKDASCKFFVVDLPKNAGATRLRFYYLDVRRYATTGIGLHNSGEGLNLVYGCRFADIGTYPAGYRHLLHGMAAVGLSDSDHNVVRNNVFVNIRNEPSDERFLHAVYMNVGSDENLVEGNLTFRVSGDPIKVRQMSNRNTVKGNTLRCSGGKSFLLDYPEHFGGKSDRIPECESWENVLTGNRLDCGYDGGDLPATYAEPGRRCGAPASWQRFHVSGNDDRCTARCP